MIILSVVSAAVPLAFVTGVIPPVLRELRSGTEGWETVVVDTDLGDLAEAAIDACPRRNLSCAVKFEVVGDSKPIVQMSRSDREPTRAEFAWPGDYRAGRQACEEIGLGTPISGTIGYLIDPPPDFSKGTARRLLELAASKHSASVKIQASVMWTCRIRNGC